MQFQKAPHANNDKLQCTNAQNNAPFLYSDGIVMDEIKKRRRRRVLTILRPREREGREGGELFCACAVETSHALSSPTLRHFVCLFCVGLSSSSSSSSSFFSLSQWTRRGSNSLILMMIRPPVSWLENRTSYKASCRTMPLW